MNSSPPVGLILAVLISVTAFWVIVILVCREIACWYWKVNEALELLRATATNTATVVNELRRSTSGAPSGPPAGG